MEPFPALHSITPSAVRTGASLPGWSAHGQQRPRSCDTAPVLGSILSPPDGFPKGDHLLGEGIAVSMARARRPAEMILAHTQAGYKQTAMAMYNASSARQRGPILPRRLRKRPSSP